MDNLSSVANLAGRTEIPADIQAWFANKKDSLVDFKLSVLESTSENASSILILREIMEHEKSLEDGSYECCLSDDL